MKGWWKTGLSALCATCTPSAPRECKITLSKMLMCIASRLCTASTPNAPRTQLQCTVPVSNHDFVPPHLYSTFCDVFGMQIGCKNNGITLYNWELDFFFVHTHFCNVLASALFTFKKKLCSFVSLNLNDETFCQILQGWQILNMEKDDQGCTYRFWQWETWKMYMTFITKNKMTTFFKTGFWRKVTIKQYNNEILRWKLILILPLAGWH